MSCNVEIERKFRVKGEFKHLAVKSIRIKQGYLCDDEGRTVRVRLWNDQGRLTIKGPSSKDGLSRFEWEICIPTDEAENLFKLCLPGGVEKTRYIVPWKGLTFEVDEFAGANRGLTLAEVELTDENEKVELPPFIGDEVTGDERFYNSYLSRHPFGEWGVRGNNG